MKNLSQSEINHLRRLLGWVRCEIGQSPKEMEDTYRDILEKWDGEISDGGKERFVKAYEKSVSIPKYVRQAVKMLGKAIADEGYEVVDGIIDHPVDPVAQEQLPDATKETRIKID